MNIRILTVKVGSQRDVVAARQRARQIARLCGFGDQEQIRVATAVSELARNVIEYAGGGLVRFAIDGERAPQCLVIDIEDEGPGIAQLDAILAGRYTSPTGLGKGLIGAKRLMDRLEIDTEPGRGTHIRARKQLPARAPLLTAQSAASLFAELAALPDDVTISEVLHQNQELLDALAELQTKQDDLLQITQELEDTNRGVVALYAELDEKAERLRQADTMKSRFLSNISHELRTPLSSIRALAKLLLERVDGELSPEQEKQVVFILQAAMTLTDLVNDLLDIAKIESGRIDVQPTRLDVAELFSALRGMLRPLLVSDAVKLVFVEPPTPLELYCDEAKLSQILRNFISNALKYTESGTITVSAQAAADGRHLTFSVADTGIGIAPEHLELIFEEFSQVENPLQRKVKGTGLGLPLCRNLARLLGGQVAVESTPGQGSTFSVTLPLAYTATHTRPAAEGAVGSHYAAAKH